jgi:hypothetical protein
VKNTAKSSETIRANKCKAKLRARGPPLNSSKEPVKISAVKAPLIAASHQHGREGDCSSGVRDF